MNSKSTVWAEVDEQGRLVLSPEMAARHGLQSGAQVRIEEDGNVLRLHRPVTHLAKVYVEPMQAETLYTRTLRDVTYLPSPRLPRPGLPKLDIDEATPEPLLRALTSGYNVTFAGNNLGGANDVCTFIESGSTAIGCEMSEANEEDCLGNTFPACGGCLWAQGIIQCP